MLAYTLQLYFDFSGYSDMALALGFMFGIKLPLNFNSPLKATSIIDFWRRWHMTMTRFFTNYLYTPVALSMTRKSMLAKHGRWTRFLRATAYPTILTFALAGLWHGAGWTFVVFGLIQGVALAINHAWRQSDMTALPAPVCWALTFFVFVFSLVFFRAPTLGVAGTMLNSMLGLGGGSAFQIVSAAAFPWLFALLVIALVAPNSQQIMRRAEISSDALPEASPAWLDRLAWEPTLVWTMASAVLFIAAIVSGIGGSPFIYYQF